jgi:hypothetical protein
MRYSCEDIKLAINVLPSDALLECLKEGAADLGEQGINLFRQAVKRSKSDLLENYLKPNLLCAGDSYIYIAEDNGRKGSRTAYDPGNTVAASMAAFGSELAFPGRWGLFANPLSWIDIDAPGPRPSDRAINIGFTFYTLEFDNIPLSEQLRVISSGGLRRQTRSFNISRTTAGARSFTVATRVSIFTLSLIFVIGTTTSRSRIIALTRITGWRIFLILIYAKLMRIAGTSSKGLFVVALGSKPNWTTHYDCGSRTVVSP